MYESSFEEELEDDDLFDEVPIFQHPTRGYYIHSDLELSVTKRPSSFSLDRPASTPGNFPEIDWLLPQDDSLNSRSEIDKEKVDVWISRLDHLISNSFHSDHSCDVTYGQFSSQDHLVSRSISSMEMAGAVIEERGPSLYSSLDEILGGTFYNSAFENGEYLRRRGGPRNPLRVGPVASYDHRPTEMETESKPDRPLIEYNTGTVCSDIFQACEILNTRYKLEDIAVRKPIMTWSKWNVSQVVRGPDDNSPIWNPSLKRKWDRPDSVIFQEIDNEITRRNDELERIVQKKTEHQRIAPKSISNQIPQPIPSFPQSSVYSSGNTSSSNNSHLTAVNQSPHPHHHHPSLNQPPVHQPGSQSSFITPEVSSQTSSESDLVTYSHLTLISTDEDTARVPSTDPSPSARLGLLRRMVKSFWNAFVGNRGCGGVRDRDKLEDRDDNEKPIYNTGC